MRVFEPFFIACLITAISPATAVAAEWATQKNSQSGVTVDVTPVDLSASAKTWDFKLVLDTHSQDLNDDLTKTAVLLDASTQSYLPVAWEGAGPGAHHREGVLRFRPIDPRPASVELRIQRAGETTPRSFRWPLQ
jgi:hypothetical protein